MSDRGGKKPRLVADRRTRPTKKKPAPKRAKAPARKARRTAKPRRGGIVGLLSGLVRWVLRLVWGITWRLTAIVALIVAIAVGYVYTTLPEVNVLLDGRSRGSVTLLDRNGDVFAWRGDQFGGVVTTDTVSRHLRNAVVATEDKRFYRHFGISPRGVAGAVRINLSEGRGPFSGHGGSTITQQTAKLLCLGVEYDKEVWKSERDYVQDCRRTTMWRKVKEAIFSLAMEVKYSKDEILSIYMNRAYFGGGAYGAEAAAQRYFGKSASAVNAAEGAMLAGLLTAPTRLSPTTNLERSQARAATVLKLMNEQGYLTSEEMAIARAEPATLSEAAEAQAGGYFADWIMDSGPEFFTRDTTEDVIIRTTLDQRIQRAAEAAMEYIFENKVSEGSKAQAAIVVMSADGAVRAMVGGRETKVTGAFNRATQANRQTGSAFKPFVYATALELGHGPFDTVVDERYCLDIPGSGQWCPSNYSRRFHGRVTLTEALARSYNIPAVKVSESVGRERVRKVASDFGIESDLADGPALALGASESTLLEMTGAYAGILNGGSSVEPYGLIELRLLGEDEPLMGTGGGIGERVINEEAARELIFMMNKVVTSGTGTRAKLPDREAAGKTGTTQAARDAWFLGFTADYVAGVWMGYDDNTPLKGVTGGGLPADIWRETMVRVHEGMEVRPLPMARDIVPPQPEPQPQPRVQQVPRREQNRARPIENILRQLLGVDR
ncbi:PBP1A family penicillin-binding protein [Roseovarius sp. SCSIO 43702]|uniref:transglycosylase domain-containing protein n=1 Tax=Roseovarius sp. SCSIO 43702 TaxID=2823043 RepID=UPI001C730862|nr:PBP1A family penicillin-binding protein [Roseovarius sp. SCSIO 43702]QYX56610.1 PBP1A family penicillin-binding protein [Roseovarius sp. SCSIO 43702]